MRSDSSVDQHTFLGVQMTMHGGAAIEMAAQFAEQRANVASAIGNAVHAGLSTVGCQYLIDLSFNACVTEADEQVGLHGVVTQALQDRPQEIGVKHVNVQCHRVALGKLLGGLSGLDQGNEPGS